MKIRKFIRVIVRLNSGIFMIFDAEKRYERKTVEKMDFTGVEIAWVDMKSNEYPVFYI